MDKEYFEFSNDKKMFIVNNFQEWKNDDHGESDSLWRSGISYITYGSKDILSGLLSSFRLRSDGKYQACRCNPQIGEDDVSRDQVILSMVALKIRNRSDLYYIARQLPYKLSKRYNMTPNLWLWLRGITGSKISDYLNQLFMIFELSINILLNKFIKSQIKPIEYDQTELDYRLEHYGEGKIRGELLNTKWKRFLWKIEFPGYGLHLSMWMVYVSRNSFLKRILQKLILTDADSNNLLAKILCGETVTDTEIEQYKPMEEWRWSQRMTDLTRTRLVPNKNIGSHSIDKDILITMNKLNRNK